jgi:uncharacterized membrane protein
MVENLFWIIYGIIALVTAIVLMIFRIKGGEWFDTMTDGCLIGLVSCFWPIGVISFLYVWISDAIKEKKTNETDR